MISEDTADNSVLSCQPHGHSEKEAQRLAWGAGHLGQIQVGSVSLSTRPPSLPLGRSPPKKEQQNWS